MNGTPRLRSAFPTSTPQPKATPVPKDASTNKPSAFYASPRLPDIGTLLPSRSEPNAPLIPFQVIDAPTQRLYVLAAYLALHLWRLYDYYHLTVDETESLWLFMKWFSIDFAFLYLLEHMRIPWLEFRPTTQFILFISHIFFDGLLMFRIPIPFSSLLIALVKLMYDRELAVSEHYVKPGNVVHNPSLILGRQIVHVLPEGTAILNPEKSPFCIDPKYSPSISLPLLINQTNPISVELVRFDLNKPENETITISSSQLKRLRKEATKGKSVSANDPITLQFPIKKTGLYRLLKVTDETKLQVQGSSEALVVSCPSASIQSSTKDRCIGDLSDLSIRVQGTPPLKVTYRKSRLGKDHENVAYESIQPEDFMSPLARQQNLGILTSRTSFDLAWARSYAVKVPLNESLISGGTQSYSILKVVDGSNNTVSYDTDDDPDARTQTLDSVAEISVHERPNVVLDRFDLQKPLMVAEGKSDFFPLKITSTGKTPVTNTDHIIIYQFTPENELANNGEHSPTAKVEERTLKHPEQKPQIRQPGLYSLRSIATKFCSGSVLEPQSFMLINPPRPDLSISSEQISDKCAGRPIGYRVGLDLVGTPPFIISYTRNGPRNKGFRNITVNGLRDQMEFRPLDAGRYTYTFTEVSDKIYPDGTSLRSKNLVLEQDVKPSASADFEGANSPRNLCIDQSAEFDVKLSGEAPWTLEYEIVHGGKRSRQKASDINEPIFRINTGQLTNGGEHSLVLTSVTDKSGCKEVLNRSAKINVQHQRPKASFGPVDGKHAIRALEGKDIDIPLRLSGEKPWYIEYQHVVDDTVTLYQKTTSYPNDIIHSQGGRGKYQITAVSDSICPGVVESYAEFEINWIPRPAVSALTSPLMSNINGSETRNPVCEGEEDAVDVVFAGRPPYVVTYETSITPESGSKVTRPKVTMNVPLHSAQIKLDTSRPGTFDYVFTSLSDNNYDTVSKGQTPLSIRQRVYPRPSVSFANPGKVYSFCQSQDDDLSVSTYDDTDSIPITLLGEPPFTVDLELKRSSRSSMRAEPLTFTNIATHAYNIQIPPRYLQPGNTALTIRRVRDSRGCERLYDSSLPVVSTSTSSRSSNAAAAPPRVQIAVHDLPSITALDDRTHYCIGERISYSLAGGSPPYTITYTFGGKEIRAHESSTEFRRLAEAPGELSITSIADARNTCKRSFAKGSYPAAAAMKKTIHALPSARVSKGKESQVDIHAGGEAEILFEFGGVPPFEFTYTRSETSGGRGKSSNARPGQVLETKTLVSEDHEMKVYARDEGAYEVVAIRDRYCSAAREGYSPGGRKLLKER